VDFFPSSYHETEASTAPIYSNRGGLNSSLDAYSAVSFDDEPPLLDGKQFFQKKKKKKKKRSPFSWVVTVLTCCFCV
jgi:hypothetical protein